MRYAVVERATRKTALLFDSDKRFSFEARKEADKLVSGSLMDVVCPGDAYCSCDFRYRLERRD